MFYAVSKFFWLFAAPSNAIALAIVVGALTWRTRWARIGRGLCLTGAGLYVLCAFSPIGALLADALESRFARPGADMPAPDGIIVLGGAMEDVMLEARGALVLGPSGTRMTEAAALALRFPGARMVFTGGSATMLGGLQALSEAEVARRLFDALGVPPGRFIYEDKSRNTWENAVFTRDIVQPKPGEKWLLVTSATHMPRSMGIFRKVGFEVTAWPAHYFTTGRTRDAFIGNHEASDNLRLVDVAVKEFVGLVAYRLSGKTDALFPAP